MQFSIFLLTLSREVPPFQVSKACFSVVLVGICPPRFDCDAAAALLEDLVINWFDLWYISAANHLRLPGPVFPSVWSCDIRPRNGAGFRRKREVCRNTPNRWSENRFCARKKFRSLGTCRRPLYRCLLEIFFIAQSSPCKLVLPQAARLLLF